MSAQENAPRSGESAAESRSTPGSFSCRRCGNPNPPLDEPPFLSPLGKQIQESICQSCWQEWFQLSVRVINEYRLNLLSPQGSAIYDQHLREFLGLRA